jgi:hypothetical protein
VDVILSHLEVYQEIITNGLDLLSFLLVTPELVRLVRPVIGKLPVIIFFMLTTIFFPLVLGN